MPSSPPRHFAFPHPIFGSRTAPSDNWQSSVYYLSWEFLRRHDGYKKTCENGGKGKYAKLYADFGNVHDVTFKDWWTKEDRGAPLFAEPSFPSSLVISPNEIGRLAPEWESGDVLFFVIPLKLPKLRIRKRFEKVLSKHHTRRRGQRTFGESIASYPIKHRPTIRSLQRYLNVYDFKVQHPELTWWKIGQELRLSAVNLLTKDELAVIALKGRTEEIRNKKNEPTRKRNLLSLAAFKDFQLAQKIIDGVGRGLFPAISPDRKKY